MLKRPIKAEHKPAPKGTIGSSNPLTEMSAWRTPANTSEQAQAYPVFGSAPLIALPYKSK